MVNINYSFTIFKQFVGYLFTLKTINHYVWLFVFHIYHKTITLVGSTCYHMISICYHIFVVGYHLCQCFVRSICFLTCCNPCGSARSVSKWLKTLEAWGLWVLGAGVLNSNRKDEESFNRLLYPDAPWCWNMHTNTFLNKITQFCR